MPTQKFLASDMKGLTPAIDPTQSQDVFALNGRNYIFDSRGPRSAFGDRLLLPQPRAKPQYCQGFRLKLRTGDRCFTIDGDGIWEWSESVGGWNCIYVTPDTTLSPYRWSYGFLGGLLYLAHPRTGILVYDLDTEICLPHSRVGVGTPTEVLSIVVNNGRLIAIGPQFMSWSEASNGLSFEPSLGGGGFQLISDRVPGSPIAVTSYARGCLTWTTGGVLRSEFTGDGAVYRHRSLNTEYRPVNSFCTCRVDDDTVVILDERGLFQSRGEAPTPFAPLFNEFLIDYIQTNNLRVGENLRIEWDELQRLLYLSVSLSYADPIYESCFVLYPPLDKWGQFSDPHYGILPLRIDDSQRADDYYGFVDGEGRVRYWQRTGSRQVSPATATNIVAANLYYPAIQKPVQYVEGDQGRIMAATGKASGFVRTGITQPANYYHDGVTVAVPPALTGLNAKIQFGLFRPTGPSAVDEMSEVVNVLVKNIESGPDGRTSLDFNLVPPATANEDYNFGNGVDDYGVENLNYVNHKLRMVSTLDGTSEFDSTVPELVGFVKGARYYACSLVGVWHIAEISAVDVGESFHIQAFEITAASAGRML